MSIENEIAGLTQSTTDLLEAVNTKKATLDTAVSNAQTAVTDATSQVSLAAAEKVGAQTARDTAETFKDQAYTYSQSAASAVAYQDLTAIAETKVETAVDVFVYDTSKDSDGGAWRQRTQGTSWYNETLNTATRGSRKEFPAVAVIVAEAAKVTIYDGDDPSMPMWMVFSGADMLQSNATYPANAITALNGSIVKGSDIYGVAIVDFIADKGDKYWNATSRRVSIHPISGRNLAGYTESTAVTLVNSYANDVAMTVLPNAPIDPATGLPIPTIAVATNGGVSVIKDDGTVVDSGYPSYVGNVAFSKQGVLGFYPQSAKVYLVASDYDADGFDFTENYDESGTLNIFRSGSGTGPIESAFNGETELMLGFDAAGNEDEGLYRIARDSDTHLVLTPDSTKFKHMHSHITSKYNTGWMNGDIKLATLSDTDDTDLVGSELVTNGTFDTDVSGWTALDSAALSVNSGNLRVTNVGSNFGKASQVVPTVAGKTYVVTIDYVGGTSGSTNLRVGSTLAAINLVPNVQINGTVRTWSFSFTAVSTTSYLAVVNDGVDGNYSDVDNVSLRLAAADRSVNNNGLQVFGTVTRTPVATGADLVAYSGFSTANYLEQPYNSDLDFGTGDFCVMGWVKVPSGAYSTLVDRTDGNRANPYFRIGTSTLGSFNLYLNSTTPVVSAILPYLTTTHFAFVRSNGVAYLYIDGVQKSSSASTQDITNTSANLIVGYDSVANDSAWDLGGSLALLRISATAPTAEQIAKIYRDEKVLFQENAQATLYGTSDAVTALAYDTDTELLHVGSSAGRSVFQGLQRVDNTTDAVGTAISASNNLVAEE